MEINLSSTDRMVRLVLGTLLLYSALLVPGRWGLLLIAVGLGALVNGATGVCLIYRLLGISTLHHPTRLVEARSGSSATAPQPQVLTPSSADDLVAAVHDAMRAGQARRLTVRDGDWTVIDIPLTMTPSGTLEVPLLEFLRARAEVTGYSQLTVKH